MNEENGNLENEDLPIEFTRKEKFMMIMGGYMGMLPAFIGFIITFIIVILLVLLWTS